MSGFAGVVLPGGAPAEVALLERMGDALAACGPDAQDAWVDGGAGLAHALLAPDPDPPEAKRQPCSLDRRTWIAADARIDGRADLVARLAGRGVPVEDGAPDAHLVLQAYAAWGEDCVEHLIGDFAFAIWDGPRRRLFCARDHFGVVPFYYAHADGGLAFSNVLNALRLHPAVSDELNERAIGDVLLFGMNMDRGATAFADVLALPPAHVLTWEDGATRTRRYWQAPEEVAEVRRGGAADVVEQFTAVFDAAVADRLRSSRLGAHMSGGMDSTSLVATAHHILSARGAPFDLRAYTIVSSGLADAEEDRWSSIAADWIGVPLEHLDMDEYATRPPDEAATPEPFAIPSQSVHGEIGIRVASFSRAQFAGFGGDPLFGNHPAWPATLADWRDRVAYARVALRERRLPRFGVRTMLRRAGGGAATAPPLPAWIDVGFARRVDLEDRWRGFREGWWGVRGPRALTHPLFPGLFALAHPGAGGLLVRTQFPFFDLRLANHVWSTPAFPWRQEKRLLREAMRGRLPPEILGRPKTPFYRPRGRVHADDPWYRLAMRDETRRWRTRLLEDTAVGLYVDIERARAMVEEPVPRRTLPHFLNCFALAHWLRYGSRLPSVRTRSAHDA